MFVASFFSGVFVRAAEPDLKAIFPLGCPRGESVEVTLVGSGLDQAESLHFTQPGVSFEHIEKNRFRITAADDAALGDSDVWIATTEGVAGPRRFHITSVPVAIEKESNDSREAAQPLTLPVVIDAKLDRAGDLDWFTFTGEKDQDVRIKCRSSSLDGSAQPVITLVGPGGHELLHTSAERLDPEVALKLPAAGAYHLLVHDRAYRKDDFSFYRLELNSPEPDSGLSRQAHGLVMPGELVAADRIDETPSRRETPQAIELPCRIGGSFAQRGEVDWFRFAAEKGSTIQIEAFGERLGQLMDIDAAIYDENGKEVVALKDLAAPKGIPTTLPLASLDPMIEWKSVWWKCVWAGSRL
jgi:hypothetical protein